MRTFSGAEWEKRFSYCRARRIGSHVAVSGTVAPSGTGSAREQTLEILHAIEASLRPFGLKRSDRVRA